MNKPTRAVVLRYGLIQIPGIVLAAVVAALLNRWLDLPLWAAVAVVLLWAAKDVFMFFLTWQAYAGGGGDGADAMVGLQGEVLDRLAPAGRVSVRGENWSARLQREGPVLETGAVVTVVGSEGLTLVVAPLHDGDCRRFSPPPQ